MWSSMIWFLKMCPLHVLIKKYRFGQFVALVPSVQTTNHILIKFTPTMYFDSKRMHVNLFWKMLKINLHSGQKIIKISF